MNTIQLQCHPQVYEPDDDSYLLAHAVEKYACGAVLDVGCGSGIQCIVASRKPEVVSTLGIDVNPHAVALSKRNARLQGVDGRCSFIEGDFFSSPALAGKKFDSIVCNPPYLPTSDEERLAGPLNSAFDGGADGRAFFDRFLESFEKFLAPGGLLLLLCSSLSDTARTQKLLQEKGFAVSEEGQASFFFEKLLVLRVQVE